MADVAAILLAAGESSRMGKLKSLLPWRGSTLMEWQLSSLTGAGLSPIIVVLGHSSEELVPLIAGHHEVRWVLNPQYLQGKTTSLKAGLRALEPPDQEAILVLNVDQPREPQVIAAVVQEHLRRRPLITVPCYQGKGGHPVVLSTALLPELLEVSEESQGLKAIMQRHAARTERLEMESPQVLLDVNTPEDYRRALEVSADG